MERGVPSCPRSLLPRMPPDQRLKEKPCSPALRTGVISRVRQHKKRTFFQNTARCPEGSPAGPVVVGRRGPVRAWPVRPSPLQPHAILGPLGRTEHRRPHLFLQHCPRVSGANQFIQLPFIGISSKGLMDTPSNVSSKAPQTPLAVSMRLY